MGLCNHEANAKQQEPGSGIIDWEQAECEQRHEEADGTDKPWSHRARIEELEDQPIDADQH